MSTTFLSPSGQSRKVALFYRWLSKVMRDVIPSDLGRSSLFMIVTDLCERYPDLKNGYFWTDFVTDVIGQGAYGIPYSDWDLLDRMTFAYFIVEGPNPVSLDNIVPGEEERDKFDDLMDGLVGAQPTDFVNLLQRQDISDFTRREGSPSAIWVLAPSMSNKMACMRTGSGRKSQREYIWVRSENWGSLSETGFELRGRHDPFVNTILLQARVNGGDRWFDVLGADVPPLFG
jgi:hypothetical protein